MPPNPLRRSLRRIYRSIKYAGDRVECPCCGAHFRQFAPGSIYSAEAGRRITLPNRRCLRCHSVDRHRIQWLYLRNRTDFFITALHVLHIAPEPQLRKRFEAQPNLTYITADLFAPEAQVRLDLTFAPFQAGSFDVILCNHVLEHIPDDRGAMREIYRVLRPGGWALLNVPAYQHLPGTLEDPAITSPAERERVFGQRDHVRMYGPDYADRLAAVGFAVSVEDYARELGPAAVRRYGLRPEMKMHYCTRPRAENIQPLV